MVEFEIPYAKFVEPRRAKEHVVMSFGGMRAVSWIFVILTTYSLFLYKVY